ncbi:hypothetical protein ACP70R_042312 [Stipagrostis hirtigluma subsp. patula]
MSAISAARAVRSLQVACAPVAIVETLPPEGLPREGERSWFQLRDDGSPGAPPPAMIGHFEQSTLHWSLSANLRSSPRSRRVVSYLLSLPYALSFPAASRAPRRTPCIYAQRVPVSASHNPSKKKERARNLPVAWGAVSLLASTRRWLLVPAPAGAVVVAVAAAAAAPPARAAAAPPVAALPAPAAWPGRRPETVSARAQMAAVLLILGCAAAALALFAMTTLNPAASSSLLLPGRCAATEAEAGGLHAGAELLLLAAGAQTLAAATTVLWPARVPALVACGLGAVTAYRAFYVLWMGMVGACHDRVDGSVVVHFWLAVAMAYVAFVAAFFVAIR